MKRLSLTEFELMCQQCTWIKGDKNWPKVLCTRENHVIKVTYKRHKLFTSSWIVPYSQRFIARSHALRRHNIIAPEVKRSYQCQRRNCYVLVYSKIQGEPLTHLLNQVDWHDVTAFLVRLHDHGVFFWDLHLGNVIRQESGQYGLLDITTAQVKRYSLILSQRVRNIARFVTIEYEAAHLLKSQVKRVIEYYLRATRWRKSKKLKFIRRLRNNLLQRGQTELLKEMEHVQI